MKVHQSVVVKVGDDDIFRIPCHVNDLWERFIYSIHYLYVYFEYNPTLLVSSSFGLSKYSGKWVFITLGVVMRSSSSKSRIILPKRKVATFAAIGRNRSNTFHESRISSTFDRIGIWAFLFFKIIWSMFEIYVQNSWILYLHTVL